MITSCFYFYFALRQCVVSATVVVVVSTTTIFFVARICFLVDFAALLRSIYLNLESSKQQVKFVDVVLPRRCPLHSTVQYLCSTSKY